MHRDVYIKEFEKLKDEQIEHIRLRDKFLYYTALIYGGVFSIILSGRGNPYPLLLILPFASFIIGSMYLTSEQKIANIGAYIKNALSKNFDDEDEEAAEYARMTSPPFGWERFVIDNGVRFVQKCLKYIVYTILYIGSGFFALLLYVLHACGFDPAKPAPSMGQIFTAVCHLQPWEMFIMGADIILISFLFLEMMVLGVSGVRHKPIPVQPRSKQAKQVGHDTETAQFQRSVHKRRKKEPVVEQEGS